QHRRERSAQLMAQHRQKLILERIGGFGVLLGFAQFVLRPPAFGDVFYKCKTKSTRSPALFIATDERHTDVNPDNRAILANVPLLHPINIAASDSLLEQLCVARPVVGMGDLPDRELQQLFATVADQLTEPIVGPQKAAVSIRLGDSD